MNEKSEEKQREARRNFLQKSLYTAPVLVALGGLVKPTTLYADGTGGPSGPPGGFNFFKRVKNETKTAPKA